MRADRLVSLVLLLQARGQLTASELASELCVSVRTVYRDLAGLSSVGVPVLAESGPGGGCRLLDGYRFPLRGLRPEEAEALLILGVPGALRELGLEAAAAAAQHQIRVTAGLDGRVPADAGGSRPDRARALVHLDMPRWFRSPEQVPQLRTLAEAVRGRRRLELRYQRAADLRPRDLAPRVVAPLGLVNKAGTWYLVAMTRAGRVAVFRAARVSWARILTESAPWPPGFDLVSFWEQWSQDFAASRPALAVRLRASPHAIAVFCEVFGDSVADALGAALPPDSEGWQELTLTFEHELAATHRLAGFGDQVEVLSPVAVRDRLVATARAILRSYGSAASLHA